MENITDDPAIRIELIAEGDLHRWWRANCLTGHYWRIYNNDASGAGVFLDGERYELHPDKMYLVAPWSELKTWSTGQHVNQLHLHFDMNQLCSRLDPPVYELDQTERMKQLCAGIRSLLGTSDPDDIWRISFYGFQLISEVLLHIPRKVLRGAESDKRITRIQRIMRNSPEKDFSLRTLADEAGMSPQNFLLKFRETAGITPYQYLLSLRYSAAARLLKETALSIPEICEKIGISDRFHFSRRFKILYGLPPATYRRKQLRAAGKKY